jgi:hypothetical protein
MTDNQTIAPPSRRVPLTGSQRVRLTRVRKGKGLVLVGIEVRLSERDKLIRMGLLDNGARNDKDAVRDAIYAFLEKHLDPRRRRGRSDPGRAMESTMADPVGTVGAVKENSLDVATKGGPKFMARLEQLADATDRHDAAFARLEIGQNALAAFNQSQQKLAEAEHKLAEADALRNQAARTLTEAQANAKAAAKAQAVEADQIVAKQRQVDKHLKQAEAREQAAIEAIARAERAQAKANRVHEDLKGRADQLLTSMREIAAA